MDYRVTRIETVSRSNLLYVDVEFLEGGQVTHLNDFVMQISPTKRVYIGPELPEGAPPDPRDYEIQVNDVRGEIVANIGRYLDRLQAAPPTPHRGERIWDTRNRGIRTEDTDPLGLRAMPGVAELIGEVRGRDHT